MILDLQVLVDSREQREQQVLLEQALQARQDMAQRVLQARSVCKVLQERRPIRVQQVLLDCKDRLAHRVLLDFLVHGVILALQAPRVFQEQGAMQVMQPIRVRLDKLEPQVQLGLAEQDPLERRERRDPQDRLDPLVTRDNKAGLESKVFRACRELLESVSKVVSDRKEISDTQDPLERPERQDQQALQVQRRPRELRDLQEPLDRQVPSVTRDSRGGLESRACRASRELLVLARKV